MSRLLERSGELLSREFDGPGCVEAVYALHPPLEAVDEPWVERERSDWRPLICVAGAAAMLLVSSGALGWKNNCGTTVPEKTAPF